MGNWIFWTLVVVLIVGWVLYRSVLKPHLKLSKAAVKAAAEPILPEPIVKAEVPDYENMRPEVIREGERLGDAALKKEREERVALKKRQAAEAEVDLRVQPTDPEVIQARYELGEGNRNGQPTKYGAVIRRPFATDDDDFSPNAAGLLGVLAVGAVLGAEPSLQAIEDLTEGRGGGKVEETPPPDDAPDADEDASDGGGEDASGD